MFRKQVEWFKGRILKAHGKQREELIDKAVEAMTDAMEQARKVQPKVTAGLLRNRVISATEDNTSILMWSHYGEAHRGVSLELSRSIPLGDDRETRVAAAKVDYPVVFPSGGVIADELPAWFGKEGAEFNDEDRRVVEVLYSKAPGWEYEQEWRYRQVVEADEPVHVYSVLDAEDLKGITFGCRTDEATRRACVTICKQAYPATVVRHLAVAEDSFGFQVRKGPGL